MKLQKVKPVTPSRRHLIKLHQKSLNLNKKPLLKNKISGLKNSSGRNHSGKITVFHAPGGPGVRMDSHIYAGYEVPPSYDSLLAKIIVLGYNRNVAIKKMISFLS